ncbi:FAD-dependent oxidoreductase [Actinoallomurus sp. CA-150999]|uniref:FAD-dependent oxidoreductase n=1 Tax=Actinoallomurus sp. CA-150999 TaxID=3239887 RepID=UPI003D8DCFDE
MCARASSAGRHRRTLVIGAGAGAFAALSLADAGARVTLVDKASGLLTGASGRNGRRLHLGEHYSADIVSSQDETALNTGRLCFLGALQMARKFPFLSSRDAVWWQFLPPDSMTSVAAYDEHLAGLRVFHRFLARIDDSVDALFGEAAARHARLPESVLRAHVAPDAAVAGYSSRESVIDLARLRRVVTARLKQSDNPADIRMNTYVTRIDRVGDEYQVWMRARHGRTTRENFDLVVNATWHDIPRLASMVAPDSGSRDTVRLKLFVTARMPPKLAAAPSFYFHRGVFGNHTNAGNGLAIVTSEAISNFAFARADRIPRSWRTLLHEGLYGAAGIDALSRLADEPNNAAGTTGCTRARDALEIALRNAGQGAPARAVAVAARHALAQEVVSDYAELVPEFKAAAATGLNFSTVVTVGRADLPDPDSPVHIRSFCVKEVAPGFYNLNPGKLTLVQLAGDFLAAIALDRTMHDNPFDEVIHGLIQANWLRDGEVLINEWSEHHRHQPEHCHDE